MKPSASEHVKLIFHGGRAIISTLLLQVSFPKIFISSVVKKAQDLGSLIHQLFPKYTIHLTDDT